jgi:dTDP-4-dehydrorhamnose reductase
MSRFLVTGAAGQLGSTFVRDLAARGADCVALTRAELDLTVDADVHEAIAAAKPNVILNCAAYNAVDRAEDDASAALAVNALAVRALGRAAAACGATLVHYSTDFVFDGLGSAPYRETDPANPRSVYGQSKLIGEWLAMDAPTAYVLRIESLFGGPQTRSSVDKIIEALRAGRDARVFVDRVVSPSYVDDVVTATLMLVDRRAPSGLYHCVNSGSTTWYGLACEIARVLKVEPRLVPVKVADVPMRAARPQYCVLSNDKLAAAGAAMASWQEAVARYVKG